jgi:protein-S-isoprenylcysteine O-methyltransferase Ste14
LGTVNIKRPDLMKRAIGVIAIFAVVLAVLIFLSAGSLAFWQGWLYLLTFLGSSLAIAFYFIERDPRLVESRIGAGPAAEQEPLQKIIQGLIRGLFFLLLILPGLDHRFGWSDLPVAWVVIGDLLVLLGFLTIFLTFKANSFASGIITLREDQSVVSSGPYAIVRHPMYAGTVLLLLGTALTLGSAWSALLVIPVFAAFAWRLSREEAFLLSNLCGYDEYCRKTPYRIVPLVW